MKIYEHEIFNILTGKISGAINRSLLKAFAAEQITVTTEQWSVLACLWNKDKVTQQALCDLTQKDKPSMTRLIDKLENAKLVVRVSAPSDRRINLIHLTDLGAAMKKKTTRIVESLVEKSLNNVSDKEVRLGREILLKIMKNLEI